MITGIQSRIIWAATNNGVTAEVNIPAQGALAQITLGQADGDGLCNSGIRAFRTRPNPGGAEVVTDFGNNFYNWPSTVFDEHLSSVTFALALGAHQEGTGVCNFFFWRP